MTVCVTSAVSVFGLVAQGVASVLAAGLVTVDCVAVYVYFSLEPSSLLLYSFLSSVLLLVVFHVFCFFVSMDSASCGLCCSCSISSLNKTTFSFMLSHLLVWIWILHDTHCENLFVLLEFKVCVRSDLMNSLSCNMKLKNVFMQSSWETLFKVNAAYITFSRLLNVT